jgi:hypothetical protein
VTGRSHAKIRRLTQQALIEWFAQSERLHIARTHYHLRGDRFRDFARRIGIDRSSAFELVMLRRHRAAIMSRCLDLQEQAAARGEPYSYPVWQTALEWFEGTAAIVRCECRAKRVRRMGDAGRLCSTSWTASSASKWIMCIGEEHQVPAVLRQGSGRLDPEWKAGCAFG